MRGACSAPARSGASPTGCAASELRHSGEIRVCIEAGLPLSYLWRDATARERAVMLFGKLRVWDTENDTGVLIYLLLAERRIEIVADRGIDARVADAHWQSLVAGMAEAFRQGRFEEGLNAAIDAVGALLVEHFPLAAGEPRRERAAGRAGDRLTGQQAAPCGPDRGGRRRSGVSAPAPGMPRASSQRQTTGRERPQERLRRTRARTADPLHSVSANRPLRHVGPIRHDESGRAGPAAVPNTMHAVEEPTLDTAARPPARRRDEARRRYLTLLFADLTGSTRLGAALEAEHYGSILDALGAVYRDVIPRHGGVVSRVQGDGVLAVFGHPETREDDGRRATEAALELHERVRRLRLDPAVAAHGPLSLHSGIHAGVVLVGKGDPTRGRFELMGNVPNIAARLSDAAAADEVLVSEETLGPQAGRFVVAAQRLLQPAGAATPIVALHVVGRAQSGSAPQPLRSRPAPVGFTGRQAELARLQAALDGARAGRTRRVMLAGAPGLGKSRLAQAFLEQCADSGCVVLRGWCEDGPAAPLMPFMHLLRGIAADAGGPADVQAIAQAATVAEAGGTSAAPAASAVPMARVADTLGRILDTLAANARMAVVFIDDWQWADDASHQLLSSMFGGDGRALMLLLTTRRLAAGGPAPSEPYEALPLAPLADEEAAQTVRRLLPSADPFLVDRICRHAGGNPLFIEELCHRARRDSRLGELGALHEGSTWLDSLIESRVARLPEAHAALVRSAAVIGNVLPVWLFERVTGCTAGDPRLRPAGARGPDLSRRAAGHAALQARHRPRRRLPLGRPASAARAAPGASPWRCSPRPDAGRAGGSQRGAGLPLRAPPTSRPRAADYAEWAGDSAPSPPRRSTARRRSTAPRWRRWTGCEPTPALARRWNEIAQRLGLADVFDPSRADLPLFERALALARSCRRPADAGARAVTGSATSTTPSATSARRSAGRARRCRRRATPATSGCGCRCRPRSARCSAPPAAMAPPGRCSTRRSPSSAATGAAAASPSGWRTRSPHARVAARRRRRLRRRPARFRRRLRAASATCRTRWRRRSTGCRRRCCCGRAAGPRRARRRSAPTRIAQRVRSLFTLTMGRAAAAYGDWKDRGDAQALQDLLDAAAWLAPRGNAAVRLVHPRLAGRRAGRRRPAGRGAPPCRAGAAAGAPARPARRRDGLPGDGAAGRARRPPRPGRPLAGPRAGDRDGARLGARARGERALPGRGRTGARRAAAGRGAARRSP